MSENNIKIKLGAILSLSGEAQEDARGIKDGIELAISELEKKGCSIEVSYVDDSSDIVTSVKAIDDLVQKDKVRAIVGPTWSNQVDSFAPIIDQEKIITFAPAVASDSVIRSSEYLLFGAEKNIYKQAPLKDFFIKNDIKKIGVILSQDKWGISHMSPIKNAALQTGVEIVFMEQLIPYMSSFGAQYIKQTINDALESKPDLIIWSGYEGEANILAEFLLENKLSIPLIGDQLLITGNRGELLKEYKGELYVFSHHFSPKFIELFTSLHNRKPTLYSDSAYDATMLLADIMLDNLDSTAREILNKIKDKDYQYEGMSGLYIFDERGDIQSSGRWLIDKVEN